MRRSPRSSYCWPPASFGPRTSRFPKVRIAKDGRSFETDAGQPFVPFGVTYYRPGTGWAPQVWKQFDAEATRKDFARMKELGINCVRVFLTYHSFYSDPGVLQAAKGWRSSTSSSAWRSRRASTSIPPAPTIGKDRRTGSRWRSADPRTLQYTEQFWKLFAARYRGPARHLRLRPEERADD